MKSFMAAAFGTRRRVWIAGAAIAAIALMALGGIVLAHLRSNNDAVASVSKPSTCDDAYRVLALRPSQVAAAKPVCLVQALTFSGELTGSVSEAYAVGADDIGPTPMCLEPKRWTAFPEALLAMVVGGKAYRFRVSAPGSSEHQAVTLGNLTNVVELAAITDPSSSWSQASGLLTVNADGVSGSIDASLLRDVAGARPVKVSGTWACGTLAPLAIFDSSVPCANFYVRNHLADTDVARMRSTACNAQDLTFSGDVTAHLDHAVTDLSIGPSGGGLVPGGDNNCSAYNNTFTASLKFTIGDETFMLDIATNNYPSVGPGQYSAKGNGLAIGAVLMLGSADPNNQGRFVADDEVFWLGTSGSFTLAPDLKSGSIDAVVQGYADHSDSTVHITGSWRCAR